jgi:hypothetical protein
VIATTLSFLLFLDHWSLTNCLTYCLAIPVLEQKGDGADLLDRYSAKSMPKLNEADIVDVLSIERRIVFR